MFPRQTVEGPVIFRDAFSNVFCTNVFIFFIYFLILFLKKFFLIISIVSSMGTFVKRDSTSIEIIKSSLSILILLNLLIKSKESLRVYLNFLFWGSQISLATVKQVASAKAWQLIIQSMSHAFQTLVYFLYI
jgi:hypothetical protein